MCLILFLIQSPPDLITYQRSHPPTPWKLALVPSFKTCKNSDLSRSSILLYPEPSPREWDSYLQVCSKNMFSPTEPQVVLHFVHIRRWLWMFYSIQPCLNLLYWYSCSLVSVLEASFCLLGVLALGSPGMAFSL